MDKLIYRTCFINTFSDLAKKWKLHLSLVLSTIMFQKEGGAMGWAAFCNCFKFKLLFQFGDSNLIGWFCTLSRNNKGLGQIKIGRVFKYLGGLFVYTMVLSKLLTQYIHNYIFVKFLLWMPTHFQYYNLLKINILLMGNIL